MTSFGQSKSEIYSERAVAKTRNAESGVCCDYPNERRERNQTYTLLNISNSVDQQEERPLECVNGTGWEEAVQSWSKTAPFAYLQLQKKVRKTRASESVNGCLYCIDLIQGLEHEPKAIVQVKSDFSTGAATGGVPDKQQTLPNSNTAANSSSVADDPKKERDCSKVHSGQVPQGGEKKKMTLKEAQPSQSEKKLFVMKDSPLFQAEKKTVPIKEYSIVAPGKPQSLETVKGKELKIQEPPLCSQAGSEVTTRASLVLPPLKDAALRKSLDNSPKKSKIVKSQASEKTFHAFSETVACPQIFKAKEIKCEQRIDRMYDVRKEHIKMQEMASFAPGFSQMPFLVQNLDRCYWHCGFLPDRKKVTMSNSVALRRHGQMSGSHFLQAKGIHAGRAHDLRTRSHMGAQQGDQAKPQEIPLLSGLFPSLTVSRVALISLPSRLT